MLNAYDIIDTIKMIEEEHLDIRTVTMGISLVDCIRGSVNETADRIYDKITSKAKNLVPVAENIGKEYGIPIVNKRVSVTPISILGGAVDTEDLTPLAMAMQRAADTLGIDFIGGFSALPGRDLQDLHFVVGAYFLLLLGSGVLFLVLDSHNYTPLKIFL